MSRAFVKEDVEVPERSTRKRSASGLPPGALNYMTRRGADRLQARLAELRSAANADDAEAVRIQAALESATIVEPPPPSDTVAFGSAVTLESADGICETYHIVGVDELDLASGHISWVSAMGRALLGVRRGQKLKLPTAAHAVRTVVEIR